MDLVTVTNLCQFGNLLLINHTMLIFMHFVVVMIVHQEAIELLVRHGLHEDATALAYEGSVINCRSIIIIVQFYNVFVAANAPASVLFDEQPGNHGGHDHNRTSELAA